MTIRMSLNSKDTDVRPLSTLILVELTYIVNTGFQQDTFASDSLQHILTLLTSLDAQCFTLLTSISLTNRSRVKDLWIFTGPAAEGGSEGTPPAMTTGASYGDLSINPTSPLPSGATQHRRYATDPTPNHPHSPTQQHTRAGTDSPQRARFPPSPQPTVLRKPAPRAQVPVSVARDSYVPPEVEQPNYRAHMPSTISDDVVNMTGVGSASPNVVYSSSPFGASQPPAKLVQQPNSPHSQPQVENASSKVASPVPISVPVVPVVAVLNGAHEQKSDGTQNGVNTRPLLAGAFRDSAMSGQSDLSYDIPIKWTGPLKEELEAAQARQATQDWTATKAQSPLTPSTPLFPGGWQPTPIDERAEESVMNLAGQAEKTTTPIHEMLSRIESPEVVGPVEVRKSESALVGLIQETSSSLPPVPPLRQKSFKSQKSDSKTSLPANTPEQGRGWILVNIEGDAAAQAGPPMTGQVSGGAWVQQPVASPDPIPPPAMASSSAKAIAVIDAVESKHKKSRSQNIPKDGREGGSGVRRFFSLNRKTTVST